MDDGTGQHGCRELVAKRISFFCSHTKQSASLVSLRLRRIALAGWAEEEVEEEEPPGVPEGRRRSLLSMVEGKGNGDE